MKKKLLVPGVVALVAAAAFGGMKLAGGGAQAEAAEVPPVVEGEVIEVAELAANLAGPELHYARVGIAVVTSEGADTAVVEGKFPLVKDAALTEIAAFTPEALRAPGGSDQLRQRLTERATALYPDGEVLRVVLTALLVQ